MREKAAVPERERFQQQEKIRAQAWARMGSGNAAPHDNQLKKVRTGLTDSLEETSGRVSELTKSHVIRADLR